MPVLSLPPRPHGAEFGSPAFQNWLDGLYQLIAYGEKGAWTATDGSGAGLSLTSVEGIYTKLGNIVIAKGTLTYPVTADGSNSRIGGLPYATKATGTLTGGNLVFTNSATANKILASAAGATTFDFYSAAGVRATNAQMSATLNYFEIIYPVS